MFKRTKGFVSLAAAIILMLGLCSCSGKTETDPSTTTDPTGTGVQAQTGETTEANDIANESGTPESASEEANAATKANASAQTEQTTKAERNVNVSAAGFIWPVPGYNEISAQYSSQYKRISIKADFGAKVVACATGKITKIYNKDDESKTPCAVLTCANGYVIEYSAANFSVKVGDVVARGDSIGFVGRYGTGPHLNISATKDGASIDPATIIKP